MSPPAPGTPPPEPRPGAGASGKPEAEQPHGAAQDERFGPLELHRVRKDDGRELIFFSDTREPA